MFQRLKGFNLDSFLDSKIAEEQAKQARTTKSSPAGRRTPSNAPGNSRRSSARTDSPSKRTGSRRRAQDGEQETPSKGPDPEDFVIGDDASDISRVATPMPVKEGSDGPILDEKAGLKVEEAKAAEPDSSSSADTGKGKEKEKAAADDQELPEDVRKKLAKLESLTTKYQDLLRNYRTAHARVSAIEPFEATLREHTPLTSIVDPSALVEFLNQRSVQSEMVMQELKRLSAENRDVVKDRDDLKVKLDEAEKKAKEAFDEAAGLREQREAASTETAGKAAGASKETPAAASENVEDDTFFSYDSELPRLEEEALQHQAEIEKQTDYINELSTENATLRSDLDATSGTLEARRLDLNAMENKVSVKDRLIEGLQKELADAKAERDSAKADLESARTAHTQDHEDGETASISLVQSEAKIVDLQEKIKGYQASLEAKNKELTEKATVAEENLRKYQAEHEENLKNGKYVQREEKMKAINQKVVASLKEDVTKAEQAKAVAEGTNKNLELEINTLRSEADTRGGIITRLRGQEDEATSWKKKHDDVAASWKKKYEAADEEWKKSLEEVEQERDAANRAAESKKGHEAAAASLRAQLKNTTKERDQAYQMIIDCSRCPPAAKEQARAPETPLLESPTGDSTPAPRSRNSSEATQQTEASTQPTDISTPAASADGGDPMATAETKKNKKKKRSKAKKKEPASEAVAPAPAQGTPAKPVTNGLANGSNENDFIEAMEDMERGEGSGQAGRLPQDNMSDQLIQRQKEAIDAHVRIISQHESTIKEKDTEIETLQGKISVHEAAIEGYEGRMKSQSVLEQEISDLKEERETHLESIMDYGSDVTSAKQALKERTEEKDRLQRDLAELEVADAKKSADLKEARMLNKEFEQELENLKTTQQKSTAASTEAMDAKVKAWREKLDKSEGAVQALEAAREACEKQIEELKAQHTVNSADLDSSRAELEAKYKSLDGEHDASKARVADLETEVAAKDARIKYLETELADATSLSQSRFKDKTDLQEHLNKVLPELKKLRLESDELKALKVEAERKGEVVKKLEGRERDLRSEIAEYKAQAQNQDKELEGLREKAKSSDERATALEDTYERTRKDLEANERTRDDAVDARDRVQAELKKTLDDLKTAKASLDQLEVQVNKSRDEARTVREELQTKSTQLVGTQSALKSSDDEKRELATQRKEAQDAKAGLEEELADTQRLLAERATEAEKLRRLLADAESRAEAKVRAKQQELDVAVEERDRAEDDANTAGRRKAREIEELKAKLRDAESSVSKAAEAKAAAERRERDYHAQEEDLKKRAAQAEEELSQRQAAMAQLQDQLDDTERQKREAEKANAELNTTLKEREARLEKSQKDLRTLKAKQGSSVTPSRPSLESSRVMTPVSRNGTPTGPQAGGQAGPLVDSVYLKIILLQFLEQREKKLQMGMVPVLGKLLHFDEQELQKWSAVVSAR